MAVSALDSRAANMGEEALDMQTILAVFQAVLVVLLD
jgi:hypothetical protein